MVDINWPTPEELADELNGWEKGRSCLMDGPEGDRRYCCLGVLARMAGFTDEDIRDESFIVTASSKKFGDGPTWLSKEVEDNLTQVNDSSKTWLPVTRLLRTLAVKMKG